MLTRQRILMQNTCREDHANICAAYQLVKKSTTTSVSPASSRAESQSSMVSSRKSASASTAAAATRNPGTINAQVRRCSACAAKSPANRWLCGAVNYAIYSRELPALLLLPDFNSFSWSTSLCCRPFLNSSMLLRASSLEHATLLDCIQRNSRRMLG